MSVETDRELLKFAAKAAGIDGIYDHDFDMLVLLDSEVVPTMWNPLKDDGDALRLAVKLGICIEFGDCADDAPVVYAGIAHERRDWPMWPRFPDPTAATRRAIVRAAAQIGRAMP